MAWGRVQAQARAYLDRALDQPRAAGVEDRADAVVEEACIDRLADVRREQVGIARIPVGRVLGREDVGRAGERRQPVAADQPGIPAYVVDVQVGADDEVEILQLEPGRGQALKERRLEIAEDRQARPLLVVACAGVDQHRLALVLDDPALQPGVDRVRRGVQVRHFDDAAGRRVALRREARKQHLRGQERATPFLDPRDLGAPDVKGVDFRVVDGQHGGTPL